MTDRERLCSGLSLAAWGYFFQIIDINLGTVSILPSFVGFLLILSAISELSAERRSLSLLRPLCILLAVWNGAGWLLSWVGGDLDGKILVLDLLVRVAALYFHFQFLTDMAALAERYQPEGEDLSGRLCRRRTVYILLVTAMSLLTSLPREIFRGWHIVCVGVMAVIGLIVILMVMSSLFQLRRFVRDGAEIAGPETE